MEQRKEEREREAGVILGLAVFQHGEELLTCGNSKSLTLAGEG